MKTRQKLTLLSLSKRREYLNIKKEKVTPIFITWKNCSTPTLNNIENSSHTTKTIKKSFTRSV